MARSEKEKSPWIDRDWTKVRKVNATIIMEDLIAKKLTLYLKNGDRRKLSVRTDATNENSTRVKQKSAFWTIRKTF